MQLIDWIVLATILAILSLCGMYIYRSKKKGSKCIGCPDSDQCTGYCKCQKK